MMVCYFILLPKISKSSKIKRGDELVLKILEYKDKVGKLPKSNDWKTLHSIGFSLQELDKANLQYCKKDESRFVLIFVKGFDSPYLTWDSSDKKWEMRGLSCP